MPRKNKQDDLKSNLMSQDMESTPTLSSFRKAGETPSTSTLVGVGTYNVSKALKKFNEQEKEFALSPTTTIKGLYERITTLKKLRDILLLQEQYSDAEIEKRQIQCYVQAKARGCRCEFDNVELKQLPKTSEEKLFDMLQLAQLDGRVKRSTNITQALLALQSGVVSEQDSEYVVARKEDFVLQLAKMRNELSSGRIPKQRHFIFSQLSEAINLAKITYGTRKPRLVKDIESGIRRQDQNLQQKLETKRKGKYDALASYFRAGGSMALLSTDYAFDGEEFKKCRPFAQGDGFISAIDLSVDTLRRTPLYKDNKTSAQKYYNQKMQKITNIKNAEAFLASFLEGTVAKNKLERLCLCDNYFDETVAATLFNVLRHTQIKYLDLSGAIFDVNSILPLSQALSTCDHLVTVDLSRIKIRQFLPKSRWSMCCGDANHFQDIPLKDQYIAALLSALRSARSTLIEVWCTGDGKNRGHAGKLSEPIIYEIIASFPQLISCHFGDQKLSPDLIGDVAVSLLSNTQMVMANMDGCRSEEVVVTSCCCDLYHQSEVVYDEASQLVLREIKTITANNKARPLSKNEITVVRHMYDKYAASLQATLAAQEAERLRKQKAAEETEAHERELAYQRKLEVARAGAGNVFVNTQQHASPIMTANPMMAASTVVPIRPTTAASVLFAPPVPKPETELIENNTLASR